MFASKERLAAVRRELAGGGVVTAAVLAQKLDVAERTIYRYIGELRELGYNILGEPGVGYHLSARAKSMKPLTQLEIYETLAESYEGAALSLRGQAAKATTLSADPTAMLAAAYVAQALRAGALDVVDKLKRNG